MTPDEKQSKQLTFDPQDGPRLSALITTAIADEKGVDVTDLDLLIDAVDIEGVQAGINAVQGNPQGGARFSFSFEGYLVTVSSDGTIELCLS